MDEPITAEAEAFVRSLADAWLAPRDRECLACYLDRSVSAFGCSSDLRFAKRYRDLAAPRSTGLERRLASMGGYCDCEYLMNAVEPARHLWTPEREIVVDGQPGCTVIEAEYPDTMPPCAGVRARSTQPCCNWSMRR